MLFSHILSFFANLVSIIIKNQICSKGCLSFFNKAFKLENVLTVTAMMFQIVTIISISEYYFVDAKTLDKSLVTKEFIQFEIWI